MLQVHSIETFGTSDGPGIRLIVFLQGCMFRCLYCHNPDTRMLSGGTMMSVKDIMEQLKKQRPYFGETGGVTVSGGEPTVQAAEVYKLFVAAHKAGIHTALDTNGGIVNNEVKKLYSVTDLVILDVKHIRPDGHQILTHHSLDSTLKMAEYREAEGKPMWLRYVLVPQHNDSEADLHAWGKKFSNYRMIERIELLPYHTYGSYKYAELGLQYPLADLPRPTTEEVDRARSILASYLPNVIVH